MGKATMTGMTFPHLAIHKVLNTSIEAINA
jgi:hypothetical protein